MIDKRKCIRCGVSMNVAPMLIQVDSASATVIRQPVTAEEEDLAELAMILCPVGAIERIPEDRE